MKQSKPILPAVGLGEPFSRTGGLVATSLFTGDLECTMKSLVAIGGSLAGMSVVLSCSSMSSLTVRCPVSGSSIVSLNPSLEAAVSHNSAAVAASNTEFYQQFM